MDELNEVEIIEAGIFSWDVRTNLLYGDGAVARYFGLARAQVDQGLPLDSYLKRIHEEDRSSILSAIRDAIISQDSYHAECRTLSAEGQWLNIMAFARCFYDKDGAPLIFSGIIYPVAADNGIDDAIVWHLLAAHEAAKVAGKTAAAARILKIISELERPGADSENDHPAIN